jgi:uncharacterized membrane protein YuzA (DUF378 family)
MVSDISGMAAPADFKQGQCRDIEFGQHGHGNCRMAGVKSTGTQASGRSNGGHDAPPATRSGITLLGTAALVVLALGGLNWGLIGVAGVDAVAWLFGASSIVTRVIDVVFGAAALYCLARLPHWSRAG